MARRLVHASLMLATGLTALGPSLARAAGPGAPVRLEPGAGHLDLSDRGTPPPAPGDPCAAGALGASGPGRGAERWLSFDLWRPAGAAGDFYLVLDAPVAERIDLCLVGPRGVERRRGGRALPAAARTIEARGLSHSLLLALEPGTGLRVVARVEADHPGMARLGLFEEAVLIQRDGLVQGLFGIGTGGALGVLLVALGLALIRPGPPTRRFLLFVAAAAACQVSVSGMPGLLFHSWAGPGERIPALLAGITGGLGLWFVEAFLGTRSRSPTLAAAERLVGLLAPASGVASLALGFLTPLPAALSALAAVLALADCAHYGLSGGPRDRAAIGVGAAIFAAGLGMAAATLLLFPGFPGGPLALQVAFGSTTGALLVALLLRGSILGDRVQRDLEEEVERRTRALRESEARFRATFQTSPDAISLNRLDDGVYVAVNESFTAITGYAEAEVVGRSVMELGLWSDQGTRRRVAEELRSRGRLRNLEAEFRRRDGTVRRGLISANTLPLGPEGRLHVLAITRDVTDRDAAARDQARLEDQLRQAQKMEAVGRLAGGVAHDFNNLLSVVSSNVELALLRVTEDETARECLVDIGHACDRATALTRQLLTFSRTSRLDPQPVDLATLVGNMRRLLVRALGEHVSLTVEIPPGVHALADPGQVEQVILNLAVNARDAMARGGRVVIGARPAGAQEVPQGLRAGRSAGFACLTVSDEGSGMTPEVRARLFEPFFTTKPRGKGTGLGLSTVYGIVEQHGGHIAVRSELGKGSSFDVFLPASAEPPKAAVRGAALAAPGGTETVVLVEDDPLVRHTAARILTRLGYDLLVAQDAAEALEIFRRRGRPPVDLLLTDVVMPGMSGPDLALRALAVLPTLRILYMSGNPQVFVDDDGIIGDGVELLRKPFTPELLASRVRRILDRAEPAEPVGRPLPAGGDDACAGAG